MNLTSSEALCDPISDFSIIVHQVLCGHQHLSAVDSARFRQHCAQCRPAYWCTAVCRCGCKHALTCELEPHIVFLFWIQKRLSFIQTNWNLFYFCLSTWQKHMSNVLSMYVAYDETLSQPSDLVSVTCSWLEALPTSRSCMPPTHTTTVALNFLWMLW